MSLFGSDGEDDEGRKENKTIPHQILDQKVREEVQSVNIAIRKVNEEGWSVKLLPENPSTDNIETVDTDLQRLYDKVSDRRPEDKCERRKIIDARQAVLELREVYAVYESISVPVELHDNSGEGNDGGVKGAS